MTREEYLEEKVKFSYEKFKQNRFFRKVRAIILKGNDVVILKTISGFTFPGGGVDDNESLADACKREAYEESGIIVKPIKVVHKNYYSVPMRYNNESFSSKRVEFFYLCEYVSQDNKQLGLDGEFEDKVEIMLVPKEKLDFLYEIKKYQFLRKLFNT